MEKEPEIRRNIFRLAFLFITFLVAALVIQYFFTRENDQVINRQINFEQVLRLKEQRLQTLLEDVLKEKDALRPFQSIYRDLPADLWQKEGLAIFLYRNDSLVYWSDNNVPAGNIFNKELVSGPFMHYANGWFRVIIKEKQNLKAIGLILIKNDFPYQNDYLVNDFQKDFNLKANVELDTIPGSVNISANSGDFLFSLNYENIHNNSLKTNLIVFTFLLVSFISLILLLFYLYNLFDFFRRNPLFLLLAFSFDAIFIRFMLLYFGIPGFLYHTDLFSPYYYATSFISPSLGDLVVNSLLWLTLAWIFYDRFTFSLLKYRKTLKIFLSYVLIFISGALFYLLISTIRRMVIDSNIELNLNNIFNIDIYSGLGFLAMTSLIMAFFLVTARLSLLICHSGIKAWTYFIIALLSSLLVIPMFSAELIAGPGLIYPTLLLAYLLSFLYFSNKTGEFRNISGALIYIVLFSLIATFVLDFYHGVKEKEKRKSLAVELSSKRDPLMEYEFSRLKSQMINDTTLIALLNKRNVSKEVDKQIITYLDKEYFNNFWNKYELLITVCQQEEVLNIQPQGYLSNCYDYFKGLVEAPGTEIISPGLFFLNNKTENNNYIATIDFLNTKEKPRDTTKIFVELFYKYISETGLGYPDLLIDKNVKVISGLSNYSYARYVDDKLIYKNGDFSYNLGFQAYEKQDKASYFIDNEGYNHYVVRQDDVNKLIISKKNMTLLDLVAPFSYFFIIFSLFLLVFLLGYMVSGGFRRLEFNFSNQLQVSIIAIIIISFFVLGMITRFNIIHLYNNKNRDNLSEKTFSVLTELEHKLGNMPALPGDMTGYITDLLNKFSLIFYSDINLFDTQGTLIASSRPQIFQEELLSEKMHTGAFYKLAYEQSLLYIQNEKIGRQEYLSAYIPFRNNEDQIIAYVNLPYFAKQTELRKEIADFLAAYINVYVLLIVLAIMVTILVSRFITRPLQLIRDKLKNIGLGKSNEKIEWTRKDEIGNLVEEYNRMIDELARSAEMLARSERESAWREMAKQVAHEIKNPLTPMKLSVQHLQKAWDEKAPDWEKRLAIFTRTIVEQIDSLSEIASEFSDFAKMPAANIEKIELTGIIKSAAELYHHHNNIRIVIEHLDQECFVLADKRQLLRVFNNLIQNAVQAIGKKGDGLIRIKLSVEDDVYLIGISDNGAGITDEQASKIFSPSFTTKSSGMGLGLAMVKSILTIIGGTVSFESKPGEGATFSIKIPACKA
ncbi:MAG: ATP-binding protein [Bacteroidales bacterium]|nr:ATP-binding protein [Bacteroidales bacterium]